MQIVCKGSDNKFKPPIVDWLTDHICALSYDKVYDVIEVDDIHYLIINDDGQRYTYRKYLFESLEELRDRKLKLLI